MAKIIAENVQVVKYHSNISINCDYKGARYHIWVHPETHVPLDDTLYKNPPLGTKSYSLGGCRTRHLLQTSKFGAALVASMRDQATANQLFAKAHAAREAKEKAEEEKRREDRVLYYKQQAGEQLYAALLLTRNLLDSFGERTDTEVHAAVSVADTALLTATLPPKEI